MGGVYIPRRRCVGCGRLAPKPELVRLASVAAGAERPPMTVLDRAGTLPGRGAYVCRSESVRAPSIECMKLATRKGTLQRAFRRAVEVPVELLESESR
ncbi:MAG TPA: YlxR family protein [Solirubrobacteraceae bacterium]|nr:YlxR family protein [Solirubrobacteraceae bacterium]